MIFETEYKWTLQSFLRSSLVALLVLQIPSIISIQGGALQIMSKRH
jgi:hypothetical protein